MIAFLIAFTSVTVLAGALLFWDVQARAREQAFDDGMRYVELLCITDRYSVEKRPLTEEEQRSLKNISEKYVYGR